MKPNALKSPRSFFACWGLLVLVALFVSNDIAFAQGALTNGENHTGAISTPGEVDTWTLEAEMGDRIALSIAEVLAGGADTGFVPWIRLVGPTGTQLGTNWGGLVGQITVTAPLTGTYTVLVASNDGGFDDTGSYQLTLAKIPGTFTVPVGDEGGPMANGANHTGVIHIGDLDQWTFQAGQGDRIALSIGEVPMGEVDPGFVPWIRLYGPTGALVGFEDWGDLVAQITATAPLTGTYTVLVASNDGGNDATGSYRLTLAKIPGTFEVPVGDEGGPMTNGANHAGVIHIGDLDQWSFHANKDDTIALSIGEVLVSEVDPGFVPWIRLYGPTGALVGFEDWGDLVAQITATAPLTGTYTVLVASNDGGNDATGQYRLTLAKIPGAFVVPVGDEGGAMTNGANHAGIIHTGDLDQWTFQAVQGNSIVVSISEVLEGEIDPGFFPWIRLFGPTGAQVGFSNWGNLAAQIDAVAPLSGKYTVLVASNDGGNDATGSYELSVSGLTATISGTVTGTNGVGLNGVSVLIYNASGSLVTSGLTNAGQYSSSVGLPTGTYYARTSSTTHIDELYNNLPCPAGSCVVTSGTPIGVTAGVTTPSVDFVLEPLGTVTVTPTTVNFAGTNTGGVLDPITPPQTVTVAFNAAATAAWSASADQPWVQLIGATGNGSSSFTVGIINPGGILPTNVLSGQANLNATITLTAANVSNSPKTISVNLSLQPGTTFTGPIGLVDTPLQNATNLVGAIGVTGWVVDDVGIASVQVYRNCLAFEPAINCQVINGHNVVFIGNATLVPGARPDIEAIFPTYPSANVGAWGYLLLTSMLPHIPNSQLFGGQGPLTLYVFATDLDGHLTQLGRTQFDTTPTQITMGNDTITKPFGAIDTPGQGATISGAAYANFGWALTPDSNTVADAGDILVPTDGSTSVVYIDGAPVGTVSYNQCRGIATSGPVTAGVFCDDDVSNIFGNATPLAPFTSRTSNPTRHRNLDAGRGPIGAYILDTTTLTNGIHTIMWVVFDDAGRGEGIGSRFFTVLNGSSLTADALVTAATGILGPADVLAASPIDPGAVWGRQGYDLAAPWESLLPDSTGQRILRMPAQGRLEVWLGDRPVQTGYLVANGTVRPLPPGSRIDAATGTFSWHPVLGYVGTYELTFLRQDGTQLPLAVTLETSGPTEGHLEMALERPAADAAVSGAFSVEGWALDTGAWQGTGVGAVHVWAQRLDVPAAAPEFLGAATLGGARPDIAATYGESFERAGWALSAAGLAPGTYEVTAYVWRTRTRQFEDARTVGITVR
jgi:hypothetical protein